VALIDIDSVLPFVAGPRPLLVPTGTGVDLPSVDLLGIG
jgi:hypothetical protein